MQETQNGRQPQISVVIPAYNCADCLRESVESVCAQSLSDWELVLVDDGSMDGTGALCDCFAAQDARIRVLHQPNGGVSAARKNGLARARAQRIAFVDADDRIEPDYLETLDGAMTRSGAAVVCCNCIDEGIDWLKNICIPEERLLTRTEEMLECYFQEMRFAYVVWGKLFRRGVLEQLDFVPLRRTEDMHMMLECFQKCGDMLLLPYGGYHYVARAASTMATSDAESVYCDNLVSLEYLCSVCAALGPQWGMRAQKLLLQRMFVCIAVHCRQMPHRTDKAFYNKLRPYTRLISTRVLVKSGHGWITMALFCCPGLIGPLLRVGFRCKKKK